MTLDKRSAWKFSLLALAAWREGRDQGYNGMVAICWSIRNRAFAPGFNWWGNDWDEVILKPWQYSSFNANDPNATKMPDSKKDSLSWNTALDAAEVVFDAWLDKSIKDPTNGATHYYNPKAVASTPKWVTDPTTVFLCQIGDHLFYRAS